MFQRGGISSCCRSRTTLSVPHHEGNQCDNRRDDQWQAPEVADGHPPPPRPDQPQDEQAVDENRCEPKVCAPSQCFFAAFRCRSFGCFSQSHWTDCKPAQVCQRGGIDRLSPSRKAQQSYVLCDGRSRTASTQNTLAAARPQPLPSCSHRIAVLSPVAISVAGLGATRRTYRSKARNGAAPRTIPSRA